MPETITDAKISLYLQTLTETPQRIAARTTGIDEVRLKTKPAPGEWSPVEILAHLRGCADVWSYSIYAMLTLDEPQLAFIHPRNWTKMQGYDGLSFVENLRAFEVERKNLLRILQSLSFEAWGRRTWFIGKANVHTIFDETHRMATHEAEHCNQLEAILFSG